MTGLRSLNGTYNFDASHTEIGFSVRHAMITNVRGTFADSTGVAQLNGENPEASSVEVTLQAASVDTRNADRDKHLRSADFFDVETYPTIKFVSTGVTLVDDSNVEVTGDLTIKDVTKQITIPLEFTGEVVDPWGQNRIGFEGKVKVNRKDFGLTWNAAMEAGGILVGEQVTLSFEVSAVKA